MSSLREVLVAIQSGQRSFRPERDNAESIQAFQPTAKALQHALERRLVPDAKFRMGKGLETHGNYLGVIVVGDLTYEGDLYLQRTAPSDTKNPEPGEVKLFLSHASQDQKLVESLLNLIQVALPIKDTAIRCTSVQGYKFRGGASIDEQLRNELKAAPAFVGVITPNSLGSVYVLFELGARWGGAHHFIPLTCLPLSQAKLPGPMAGLHFLRLQLRQDLAQFIEELAVLLGEQALPPSTYANEIESLLAFAGAAAVEREEGNLSKEQADGLSELYSDKVKFQLFAALEQYARNDMRQHYADGRVAAIMQELKRAYTVVVNRLTRPMIASFRVRGGMRFDKIVRNVSRRIVVTAFDSIRQYVAEAVKNGENIDAVVAMIQRIVGVANIKGANLIVADIERHYQKPGQE